jgi:hypothetical protein
MLAWFCSKASAVSAAIECCGKLGPADWNKFFSVGIVSVSATDAGVTKGAADDIGTIVCASASDSSRASCNGVRDDIEVVFSSASRRIARDSNAARKCDGNVRPRLSALRKMPAAARGLKKNLGGTWGSKISDNEHSTASLGDSEKSAVEHAPLNPIPALDHENPEDFCKVSAFVATEKSGNILEHKPSGSNGFKESRKVVKESSALTGEAGSLSSHGYVLAGNSGANNIHSVEFMTTKFFDVFIESGFRPMPPKDSSAIFINLHLPLDFKSTRAF